MGPGNSLDVSVMFPSFTFPLRFRVEISYTMCMHIYIYICIYIYVEGLGPGVKIHQRGVQWKQGVVVYIML